MRGDYEAEELDWLVSLGPSPRAWGLLVGLGVSHPRHPGHPHVRGDYGGHRGYGGVGPGHPHVRGDYGPAEVPVPRGPWAIPTCVGTTIRSLR